MNAQVESQVGGKLDGLKWGVVLALVVAGVGGNLYFGTANLWYRAIALVALGVVAAVLALSTERGRAFLGLLKEAQIEARKVVWPSRDETLKTTWFVMAVVAVMSLVLWGLDSLFSWLITKVIG